MRASSQIWRQRIGPWGWSVFSAREPTITTCHPRPISSFFEASFILRTRPTSRRSRRNATGHLRVSDDRERDTRPARGQRVDVRRSERCVRGRAHGAAATVESTRSSVQVCIRTTLRRSAPMLPGSARGENHRRPCRSTRRVPPMCMPSQAPYSQTACVVVGYPSFFGGVADLRPTADIAHAHGALLVTATWEPYALAVLEPPGILGADIAVGEGQPLGLPPQFGGPGWVSSRARATASTCSRCPGGCRRTVDRTGRRGYVLTLATREQHIRRERATSNICTNSGLCATAVAIKMSLLGRRGFITMQRGSVLRRRSTSSSRLRRCQGMSCPSRRPRTTSSPSAFVAGMRGSSCPPSYTRGSWHGTILDASSRSPRLASNPRPPSDTRGKTSTASPKHSVATP